MSKQTIIVAALMWIAWLGTSTTWPNNFGDPFRSTAQAIQYRESATKSKQTIKVNRIDGGLGEYAQNLANLLSDNKELLGYGAIAGFGILIMGLAIGSASSSSRSKTQAQLELLRQEKEKAENLAKLKSEFLNQVSHELRTPLAVIIGYIECITDGLYGNIETKHLEILQVVSKQSVHLKNMIDQILIYSRLEAGKQPIRIEELDLSKVLKELKDTFEFLCRQKGLDLQWEVFRDSIPIRSDATRLKEVISNLLQNAVKYTDQGAITLRVSKLAPNDSLVVEVQDTGMGISDTHLASIFEPFMQVHKTSTEHSRGGIGLGLSIVKKHLDQIKGTISVKSQIGKGSSFRIVLPLAADKVKSSPRWLFGRMKIRSHLNAREMVASRSDPTRPQEAVKTTHAVG